MQQPRWIGAILLTLCLASYFLIGATNAPTPTRTVWLQTMDSCRQAIPGASFILTGPGLTVKRGPGPGVKPKSVGPGSCPIQRGNCVTVPTGCLSWDIPVPASGTVTYKIRETSTPAGYVPCNGGSVCPGGPEVVTLTINAAGQVAATTLNIYPDAKSVTYPTTGAPYTGTQTDPFVTHNFQLGTISCDGDHDADDYLSGGVGSHCDSDRDRS